MKKFNQYFIYILVYCYLALFFIKGYYPANETGVLFISFIIFMLFIYNFVGIIIKEQLNAKINEIFLQFEESLITNYNQLIKLKTNYLKMLSNVNIYQRLSSYFFNFILNLNSSLKFNYSVLISAKVNQDLNNIIMLEKNSVSNFLDACEKFSLDNTKENVNNNL